MDPTTPCKSFGIPWILEDRLVAFRNDLRKSLPPRDDAKLHIAINRDCLMGCSFPSGWSYFPSFCFDSIRIRFVVLSKYLVQLTAIAIRNSIMRIESDRLVVIR